ncbi:DNA mismatch repair protein MutL [Coprinellus micaceus]|uniref:DNA mismatch repair protein MutL n=1 Tax=Coprinellus micaceus TaxID=71717 RepID=A0A4Y7SVN4_COPMI|nr:DNA mismatch repair protein MutL [Coprinellus micaceus]
MASTNIKAIDKASVHRITSGQVVELVENSLDAGATNIEIRFKNYGFKSVEVIDNGSGIAEMDFESIALKHHTSKLETYEDLSLVETFGFRGEALSSLCALCDKVSVTTATKGASPKGTCLDMLKTGEVGSRGVVARKQGTTVSLLDLFSPLPVRRKEFERNIKREFGKALSLLQAYALVPCSSEPPVRLSVANFSDKGHKSLLLQTPGKSSAKAAVTALWGPAALDNVVDLDISFEVEVEKSVVKRLQMLNQEPQESTTIEVKGLISKFAIGCGRTNLERQFFYVNGRPCALPKVQKAFNEVYRTFNMNQSPFIVANFIIPTGMFTFRPVSCDINVSPDKRTIFVHNESNLVAALKVTLESCFAPSRSTFDLTETQTLTQSVLSPIVVPRRSGRQSRVNEVEQQRELGPSKPTDPGLANGDSEILDIPSSSPPLGLAIQAAHSPPAARLAGADAMDVIPSSDHRPVEPTPSRSSDVAPSSSREADLVVDTTRSRWSAVSTPAHTSRRSSVSTFVPSSQTAPTSPGLPQLSKEGSAHSSRERRMDDELVAAVYDKAGPRVAKRPISGQADHAPPPRKKRAVVRGPPSLNIASFALLGSQVLRSPPEPPQEDSDDTQSSTPPKSPSGHRNRPCPSDEEDNPLIEHLPKGVDSNLTGQAEEVPVPGEEAFPDAVAGEELPPIEFFDINDVLSSWKRHLGPVTPRKGGQLVDIGNSAKVPSDAGVHNSENDAKAAEALSRVIDKSDFASMDILGQFNLGFIICRRRKSFRESFSTMDDLFIVDQHASDEKYNFESLQLTTKIQSQKLLRPRPLELTAADELVASENLQVLKDNGFEVHVAPDNDTCGARLQLTAQPVSKNTVFDMKGKKST